jgi:oxygen-independent coproporphyrinogen-3 oxidase
MSNTKLNELRRAIEAMDFPNYIYSYPPKRAYRPFAERLDLRDSWREQQGDLNVYLHIPFCNYRCTFCTLFLTTAQTPDQVESYVEAVENQIRLYGELIGHLRVASIYLGGGTPTVLSPGQFGRIFAALRSEFPRLAPEAEVSIEGTPDTMTPEILDCLLSLGINRISMGIQSFHPDEMWRAGRRYGVQVAVDAIENIRRAGFENFNLDLIYGLEGQNLDTWQMSLSKTLSFSPATLSLYPAVFRPLSGIHKLKSRSPEIFPRERLRGEMYDMSVDLLAERGFRQESSIRFTRHAPGGYRQEASDFQGVPLLGLGAGARSYCGDLHYTTDYAVGKRSTLEIIGAFIERHRQPRYDLEYGFQLDRDEAERRFVILNLLLDQLSLPPYVQRFGTDPLERFAKEVEALESEGCIDRDGDGNVRLTRRGFKFSNLVGNLFYSERVKELEASYSPK